ncbi:phenylalanine-tRNA ligase, alpha subunit [Anncaliia algerae PRA339]|uniref:phenylalanine--tRNA ligase n=1 Tax=Anncaliia algerae PRA339 TaxID=1288291 RepID=A0A059F3A1_9MICR|nr:phenylalanine-tRNA ligase, alpha subunit [Anncaliia algerae PRA339]
MKEIQQRIMSLLKDNEELSSLSLDIPSNILHGALLSMQSTNIITFDQKERIINMVTEEGKEILKSGSKEYNFYLTISDNDDLSVCQNDKIGSAFAFKYKYIYKEGNHVKKNSNVIDLIKKNLEEMNDLNELMKRNLVKEKKEIYYLIRKGSDFENTKEYTDKIDISYLNNEMGHLTLKKYNFDSKGLAINHGSLHPLLKFKAEIKKIFLEMGFIEMDTSRYVESAFWNFDSLYQPQDHPSRDLHDTFYLSNEIIVSDLEITEEIKNEILKKIEEKDFSYENNEIKVFKHFNREEMQQEKGIIKVVIREKEEIDQQYLERVKKTHEEGLNESVGYKYKWSKEESSKVTLRTHTTAVSARYLYNMTEGERFFSIDRVFRNETVDSTHLPEFHQVEGLLIGDNLNLSDLIQTITLFFNKLGIKELKFKPAYNPYTEPSAEVYGYHPLLKRWIEIGNSGVFRPEMIRTMGYKDKTALGFGLSVERPAMIMYGCDNIRDLMGNRVNLEFVKEEGICMVDNN